MAVPIQIEIPSALCRLGNLSPYLTLLVEQPVTQRTVLDALEQHCPALTGTLRDPDSGVRRPFIRFFACGEDLSHLPPDAVLPEEVGGGAEPLLILGAIAGG